MAGGGLVAQGLERRIYELRGHNLLLDDDLASMYGVDVRVLNQAVSRNAERFPDDFMFRLTGGGGQSFEITICDLKAGSGLTSLPATRLHRRGRRYAIECS